VVGKVNRKHASKEPARDLLPGTDLRERPVPARIEIDLQRLRMRINRFLFHVVIDSVPLSRSMTFNNRLPILRQVSFGEL